MRNLLAFDLGASNGRAILGQFDGEKITMILPLRLMILHFSHIFFTEGLTFIVMMPPCLWFRLLGTPCDPALRQIVRGHFHRDFVTGQNADKVHPQLAGNVRQDLVAVLKLYLKGRVGQRIRHHAFQFDNVLFRQIEFLLVLADRRGWAPPADRRSVNRAG